MLMRDLKKLRGYIYLYIHTIIKTAYASHNEERGMPLIDLDMDECKLQKQTRGYGRRAYGGSL